MDYVLTEKELRICLRDVDVFSGETGDEMFDHYFVDAKVNVGRSW